MLRKHGEHEPVAFTGNGRTGTPGIVLHSPVFYDWIVWLALMGKERAFRERVLDLADLSSAGRVLDIGCGTGNLAIAAKRRLGATTAVYGIDASSEMIARAEKKARRAGVEVEFKAGLVEALPFPESYFDTILSTVMLHHLPPGARLQCAREMQRVIKPGGHVLAVDFEGSNPSGGFLSHLHRRHGHVNLRDLITLLNEAELKVVSSGAVGIRDLNFVLATLPCCR